VGVEVPGHDGVQSRFALGPNRRFEVTEVPVKVLKATVGGEVAAVKQYTTDPGPREAHPRALVRYAGWRTARYVDSTFAVRAGDPPLRARPNISNMIYGVYILVYGIHIV